MKPKSQHERSVLLLSISPLVCLFVCLCARVLLGSIKGTHKAGRYTPHPVHSALTLPDKGIWVRLKLRKEPEDLASAETDEERDTRETGRC